jgi:hypothetical protein
VVSGGFGAPWRLRREGTHRWTPNWSKPVMSSSAASSSSSLLSRCSYVRALGLGRGAAVLGDAPRLSGLLVPLLFASPSRCGSDGTLKASVSESPRETGDGLRTVKETEPDILDREKGEEGRAPLCSTPGLTRTCFSMLLSTLARSSVKPCRGGRSTYANVSGQQFLLGSSFRPSSHPPGQSDGASPKPSPLDSLVLASLARSKGPSLFNLLEQQREFSGKVIPASLQSEPTPRQTRRCDLAAPAHERGLVLIAHALADAEDDNVRTITLSTGFALEAKQNEGESLILGCLHTLNEVCSLCFRHEPSCLG